MDHNEPVRSTYLDASRAALRLLARSEVHEGWGSVSVLPPMTVGELAAHLARSILQVEWFLEEPLPAVRLIDAAAYYGDLQGTTDPGSPLNAGVRARSAESASAGWRVLVESSREALARLEDRLASEPDERRIVALGRVLLLDEYLKTRLVEICVHVEDLALSIDVGVPELPASAVDVAVRTLVDAARHRHGAPAVLRALTRRERDDADALRVL